MNENRDPEEQDLFLRRLKEIEWKQKGRIREVEE